MLLSSNSIVPYSLGCEGCFVVTKITLFVVLFLFLFKATPAIADDSLDLTEHATQRHALAPADSYFGLCRMSVLGIRNAIHDLSALIDTAPSNKLSTLYHKLTMVEDAILDLKNHYPSDSWLPGFGLSIAQAFVRFPFGDAQVRANDTLDWVIADYPTSAQASYAFRMIRARLHPTVMDDIPIEPILPIYAVPPTTPEHSTNAKSKVR
jgi:hypothetical protein